MNPSTYTFWEAGVERALVYTHIHMFCSSIIRKRIFMEEEVVMTYISCSWTLLHIRINCGEGNGTPLQYSCLENPMDRGAWLAAVHEVVKSQTWLSDFTLTFHFHALEKEMATHSSVLAWQIPGTGEPGGLQSMGSHRVGHNWNNLAVAAAAKMTSIVKLDVKLDLRYLSLLKCN